MFNGKCHYKSPFSIAMLVYQRVVWLASLQHAEWSECWAIADSYDVNLYRLYLLSNGRCSLRPRRHQCQASSSVLTSSRWACQGGETPRWKTQLSRWDFITKRKWKDAESRPVPHDLAILMDSKCSKKEVAILMIWWSKKLRVSVRISCMEAMGPSDQRDKRDLRHTLKSHTTKGLKKN